jgi:hypothetical protein
MTMSASKRQRDESSSSSPPSVEIQQISTVFRRWLDEGTLLPDGTMEHASLGITVGDENLVISLGDTVWLRSPNEDPALEASSDYQEDDVDYYGSVVARNNASIARIECMWEEPATATATATSRSKEDDGRFKIRARWFLKVCNVLLYTALHYTVMYYTVMHHRIRTPRIDGWID